MTATTRTIPESDDDIARHREALRLLDDARKREAGVPAAREAERQAVRAAYERARVEEAAALEAYARAG